MFISLGRRVLSSSRSPSESLRRKLDQNHHVYRDTLLQVHTVLSWLLRHIFRHFHIISVTHDDDVEGYLMGAVQEMFFY